MLSCKKSHNLTRQFLIDISFLECICRKLKQQNNVSFDDLFRNENIFVRNRMRESVMSKKNTIQICPDREKSRLDKSSKNVTYWSPEYWISCPIRTFPWEINRSGHKIFSKNILESFENKNSRIYVCFEVKILFWPVMWKWYHMLARIFELLSLFLLSSFVTWKSHTGCWIL